jgi:hypothetical protein
MSQPIHSLLSDREITHGNFQDTARIAQNLKTVIEHEVQLRHARTQSPMPYVLRESIDNILTKIARVIAGEPETEDHWNDIQGYAKLAAQYVEDGKPTPARADAFMVKAT